MSTPMPEPTEERVTITLTREDARVTLMGLKAARKAWIADVRSVGGKTTPTPYDDAINAIAEQVREVAR